MLRDSDVAIPLRGLANDLHEFGTLLLRWTVRMLVLRECGRRNRSRQKKGTGERLAT